MSRIFKRPMFRKGGEVMEGIMTGIQPRRNYADGKTREEIISGSLENLSPSSQGYAQSFMDLAKLGGTSNRDLLTNVLIQGGLRGMSQTGGGGTLGNLAKAFEEPVAGALKQRSANQQLDISGAMKGLDLGVQRDIAMAKNLKNKIFESSTEDSRIQMRLNNLKNSPGYDATEESNDTIRIRQEEKLRTQGKFGDFVGTGPLTATGELAEDVIESDPNRYPPGTIIYDSYTKRMKIVDDNQNLIDYEFGAIKEG